MEEEKGQGDFRTYKERNWHSYTRSPAFHVYVLLAISLLLSTVFLIVAVSKAVALSSEWAELNVELPKKMEGHDFDLFPCGPNTREWEYFNGKCYFFSLEKTSWTEARLQCERRAAQLVMIETMAEQNFLQTYTKNERYWIGLTDMSMEGHWEWLDGRNGITGFTYWKQGEPNDDYRGEDCAHLWVYGEWNDVYCTYPCFYVCEKPLRDTRPQHQG
ncbi:hepatic lectin [Pogona vitticeps]